MQHNVLPQVLEPSIDQKQAVSISIRDFLDMEFPERKMLLSPWLPEQGLAMVVAPRGIGKTFFGMNVAYAVAAGSSFLGWKASEPKPVLYIDGEMPATVMQERLSSIALSADKEPIDFQLITPDMQLTPGLLPMGMPDLSTHEGQAEIAAHTDRASLIVIDNIATLCRTGKENEGESWLAVQEWALGLRACGKSVLFIHHTGKGGQQRGTSRREDVLDTVINLSVPPDYNPEEGAKFQVRFTKSRGFYGEDAAPLEVSLTTDVDGSQLWVYSSLQESTFMRVVELANDGLSQIEIATELEVNRSTVCRHFNRAKNEGLIKGGKQ
ncbi:MAG: AAA family ATPase [Porticoccus sp.]